MTEKFAGGLLITLAGVAAIVGAIAVALVIPEGLSADGGIGFVFLASGLSLLLISPFLWAAGKALEILSRIEVNTRKRTE